MGIALRTSSDWILTAPHAKKAGGTAGPNTANRTEVLRRGRLTHSLVAWLSPPLRRRRFPQVLRCLRSRPQQGPSLYSQSERVGSYTRFNKGGKMKFQAHHQPACDTLVTAQPRRARGWSSPGALL